MARLPLLSLLLMGPPFGRGGADATGDRRVAGAARRGRAEGVSVVTERARDRPQAAMGDKAEAGGRERRDSSWRRREKPMTLGECGPFWVEARRGANNHRHPPKSKDNSQCQLLVQSTVTGD